MLDNFHDVNTSMVSLTASGCGGNEAMFITSFFFIIIVTVIAGVIVIILEVAWIELWEPGKHSATELQPQPSLFPPCRFNRLLFFKCDNYWRHFFNFTFVYMCVSTCAVASV